MDNNTVYEWILHSTFTVSAREQSLQSAKPHLSTLAEVFIQTFLLSVLLFYWIRHPKRWLNWVLGVAFRLILIFPALGLIVTRPT